MAPPTISTGRYQPVVLLPCPGNYRRPRADRTPYLLRVMQVLLQSSCRPMPHEHHYLGHFSSRAVGLLARQDR